MTILCALTQKRTILFSTILFWVSAQSIVKTPSKFLKLGTHRAGDQPPSPNIVKKFSVAYEAVHLLCVFRVLKTIHGI